MKLSEYKIFINNSLKENLPYELRKIFDRKMDYFAKNPFHPSLNTRKYSVSGKTLKFLGVDEVWEFYINRREYRCIFYTIHSEKKIIIAEVGNHEYIKRKYS